MYEKKNLTPEQRSEIGRKAAAARKNPGRKKGSKTRPLEERQAKPKISRNYYQKKPKDPEAVRIRMAWARAHVKNWGHKKDPEKYFSSSDKATAIHVLEFDRRVLRKLAKFRGITLVKLIHNFVLKALSVPDYKELLADEIAECNAAQAAKTAGVGGDAAPAADEQGGNAPATPAIPE